MNNMIKCPSCAATLSVVPNIPSMYCSCCGSQIQLGSAFSNVSETNMKKMRERSQMAYSLASMIEAVKEPMLNIEAQRQRLEYLKNECRDARLRYEEFLANPGEMSGINRDVQENALRGRIQFLGNQVVEARQKYFEYENILSRYSHLKIPSQYQNADALNYILNLFYTQQAFCMLEAFGKYEEYLKQIRCESAQSSEQSFQPDYESYQDADSRDDFNDFESFESPSDEYCLDLIQEQDVGSDRHSQSLGKTVNKLVKHMENKEKRRFARRIGQGIADKTKDMAKQAAANKAKEMAKQAAVDTAKKMAKQAAANKVKEMAQQAAADKAKEMMKHAAADQAKKMAKQAVAHQADQMARKAVSKQASQLAKGAGKKVGKAAAKGIWNGLRKGI